MNCIFLKRIEKTILSLLILSTVIVLVQANFAKNHVIQKRTEGDYKIIESETFCQIKDDNAPTGVRDEYSFILGTIEESSSLIFYISHYNVEVSVGEELVYLMEKSEDTIQTSGNVWVMVPLQKSDMGKEIRVILSPLYTDYQKNPVFILGTESAIYNSLFYRAIPALILSGGTILSGIFLLCVAIYQRTKKKEVYRLYAIGTLAISAGMWRFTYDWFSYILLKNQSVLLYTISVISLMFVAVSMLNVVEADEKYKKFAQVCSVAYGIIYSIQLIAQMFGFLDLRQTLTVIHGTIVFSAVVICVGGNRTRLKKTWKQGSILRRDASFLLGIGAIIDLLLYYFSQTSFEMIYTLIGILCFTLLEGVKFMLSYAKQEQNLKEMETQLILSRTKIMMSQIRSHFVFNLLNAISGMCKYDPEKADDTIVRFSRYLRNNIDIMENDKNIPFSIDLQQLEDYVILEQVRFGDKIEFYTDIETDSFMIPQLILQPIVENAIKHGVSKKLTNGTIILRTREQDGQILITVEDDGVGFDKKELEKETSVGLRNIRFRLSQLVNGTMDIESEPGKGTIVTIKIPKKEQSL